MGGHTDPWRLRAEWKDPPAEFSPVPSWWWSGERVTRDRLRWQLERLVEGGIHNALVMNLAPVGPTFGAPADDPPWFSEEWWELFGGMCEDARQLGVRVWFYDQLGFSSGNVQGRLMQRRPDFAGQVIERVVHEGEEPCELRCPPAGTAVAAAVVPLGPDGAAAGPPTPLPVADGIARWGGGARSRAMLAYSRPHGFDMLAEAAAGALIDAVHGAFERRLPHLLGDVIVGSFQDELPKIGTWTAGFEAAFTTRHGYPIAPRIAALWEDWGPEARKLRGDYHATRTALAEAAFFRPLFEWHERHGMIAACDQQSPARSGLPLGGSQLYGDYLATHRWFGSPGSDHWGDSKVHSSIAHLYERPRVWLEAFHTSGWGATLEETFDWLLPYLRAGATLYDPVLFHYSTRGGWFEWAPQSACWRQPYWRHHRLFATAVARLCALLSAGVHRCDVAVLYPSATVHAHLQPDRALTDVELGLAGDGAGPAGASPADAADAAYLALVGEQRWLDVTHGVLDRDRRDFDVVDEDSVQRATVEDGALCVAGERYRAVVLPAVDVIAGGTASRLRTFCAAGGVVVAVGRVPAHAAGMAGDDAEVRALVESGALRLVEHPEQVPDALADLPRTVDAPVPSLLRRVGDEHVLFLPALHPGATVAVGDKALSGLFVTDYDFDAARYPESMTVRVRDVPGTPVLWDVADGSRRAVPTRALGDGVSELQLDRGSAPAHVVVWEAADAPPARAPTADGDAVDVGGDWEVRLEPTMDNRWGDLDRPAHDGSPPLRIWAMDGRSDPDGVGVAQGWPSRDDGWAPARATFGPRARAIGPLPLDELPAPLTAEQVGDIADDRWSEVVYSPARGVDKDRNHALQLGPKGFVPDEFLVWPCPAPGSGVQLRTLVTAASGPAHLAIGAAAAKQVWWNGEPLDPDGGGYLYLAPVDVAAGDNLLEVRLSESEATAWSILPRDQLELRAFWALVTDPAAFARPETIVATGPPVPGTSVRYVGAVAVAGEPERAHLVVGTAGSAHVAVNGAEVGAIAPLGYYEELYGDMPTFHRFDVTEHVRRGSNEVAVTLSDDAAHRTLYADLVLDAGGERLHLATGPGWRATRGDAPAAIGCVRGVWFDPRYPVAAPRPHPLPETRWLEDVAPAPVVLPAEGAADRVPAAQWLRLALPPGAVHVTLPVAGDLRAWVDGEEVEVADGAVVLSEGTAARRLVLRVDAPPGVRAGACWTAPPVVTCGAGRMPAGDWGELGLGGWSGGVRYRRRVTVAGEGDGAQRRTILDLGSVRGTAEVRVNGEPVGVRIFSPWTFDITDAVRPGGNELEVLVLNTLGPYLAQQSPTPYVLPPQRTSGLLGPVRLRSTVLPNDG